MSTAVVIPAIPVAKKPSEFKSIMAHILKFATLGLVDIIKYVPEATALAQVLFPEVPAVGAAGATAVKVATLIQNTVLAVQAKYATATATPETNAQKLADALSIIESPAITLLTEVGVNADTARVTNSVNAVVAILKNAQAPAS